MVMLENYDISAPKVRNFFCDVKADSEMIQIVNLSDLISQEFENTLKLLFNYWREVRKVLKRVQQALPGEEVSNVFSNAWKSFVNMQGDREGPSTWN